MKHRDNGNNGKITRRVLVADDDTGFLDSLTIALRREAAEVMAARSSEEVLSLLEHTEPDLLMMDLRLGPQLGVEVAEWARLRYPDLPVIFMSAYPYTELAGRISRISEYPVLEKPFDIRDLAQMLELQAA
ncbi:MAG: response regulator [Candidatus Zixiibacteriota bacterium]|nr:MAG: response regulator [candidate division Zixibacteria bacterium]